VCVLAYYGARFVLVIVPLDLALAS